LCWLPKDRTWEICETKDSEEETMKRDTEDPRAYIYQEWRNRNRWKVIRTAGGILAVVATLILFATDYL
jgi:hypothetical protein